MTRERIQRQKRAAYERIIILIAVLYTAGIATYWLIAFGKLW